MSSENKEKVAETVEEKLSDYSFGQTIIDYIKTFIEMIKAAVRGENIPVLTIAAITGALIYLLCPIDCIPDYIPYGGLIDDAAIIGFVAASIKEDIDQFKERRKNDGKHQST